MVLSACMMLEHSEFEKSPASTRPLPKWWKRAGDVLRQLKMSGAQSVIEQLRRHHAADATPSFPS
jgi:hypothetical protein